MLSIHTMDIRAVDLNLLKAFDALHNERAVTRAAGRIGLSQPAMSHALSRLRGLFSDDLFVRTQSGMEPTARAREIAPLISAAIEQIEAALNLGAVADHEAEHTRVKIDHLRHVVDIKPDMAEARGGIHRSSPGW